MVLRASSCSRSLLRLRTRHRSRPAGGRRQRRAADRARDRRLERRSAGDPRRDHGLASAAATPGLGRSRRRLTPPPDAASLSRNATARAPDDGGERLLMEVFAEYGNEGASSRPGAVDVVAARRPGGRRIAEMEQLTRVSGLYRLALNPRKQFDVQQPHRRRAPTSRSRCRPATRSSPKRRTGRRRSCCSAAGGCGSRRRTRPNGRRCAFSPATTRSTGDFDAAFLRVRPADFETMFPPRR